MNNNMDKLKQFIDNNREAFDKEDLPAGHELRFEKRLPRHRNPFRQYSLYALSIAASVAMLLLLAIPFRGIDRQAAGKDVKCQTVIEIENLRLYYNMQMNEVIARMEAVDMGGNLLVKKQLLEESARVIQASRQFEEIVMPQLPCAQETLYAMTQHYGTSLQSLNFMLEQMEDVTE